MKLFGNYSRRLVLLVLLFLGAGAIGIQYFKFEYLSHGTYCLNEYAIQIPKAEWGEPNSINFKNINSLQLLLFALGYYSIPRQTGADSLDFDRTLQKYGVFGDLFISTPKTYSGASTLRFMNMRQSIDAMKNPVIFPVTKETKLSNRRVIDKCINEYGAECETFILANNLLLVKYPIATNARNKVMYYSLGRETLNVSFYLPLNEDFEATLSRIKFGRCPLSK